MADRPPTSISQKLDSFVRGLPDDALRVRLLQVLMELNGRATVRELANRMSSQAPGDAAQVIIAAAKDGLVVFPEKDSSVVRITDLGERLASRQPRSTY